MRYLLTLILIMGLFSKLFGQSEENNLDSANIQNIRLEYNVMSNITLETADKYGNEKNFKLIENGIYQDLKDEDDANCRMTISYELNSDDNQYPLEDVLEKYYLHVSDFLELENSPDSNKIKQELGGTLADIKKAQEILGKKIYNQDYEDEDEDEDGQVRVKLVIE